MKYFGIVRILFLSGLFIIGFGIKTYSQITLGAGISGMKYYDQATQRPIAVGLNTNLAIELSPKTRLVIEPTFFVPVSYSYNQQWNIYNIPNVQTNEQLKTVEAAALYQFDLIGNNKGGGVLYLAAGPALMIYNANVTRENIANYNYSGSFHDYMFDARAGLEIPFLLFFKLYGEVEIVPKITSDFKSNLVNYTPNAGSVMAATIGIRIHI